MEVERKRFCSRVVPLVAFVIGLAGCSNAAPQQSATASKGQTGKTVQPAPPITKRETAEPTEMPAATPSEEKAASSEPAQGAQAEAGKPAEKPVTAENATAEQQAGADIGQLDPLALIMPTVKMTEQEAKTCQVKVGDTLPDVRLPKLEGGEQTLKDLYGQRLTVVLFWKATQPYALEELGDLQRMVAGPFADRQVNVVGIDVQDQPQVAQQAVGEEKVAYPNLLDSTGAAFAQVASGLMPRTYLVDAQGKILWFDMEYSRSTRRDLLRAIRATLSVNE